MGGKHGGPGREMVPHQRSALRCPTSTSSPLCHGCWLWDLRLGTRSPFPCLLVSWPPAPDPAVHLFPHPFFTCSLGFQSFFFFKIFWMWDIFKVFTEFVILLFWFFGCEACGILVPLTSDRTCTPCTGR